MGLISGSQSQDKDLRQVWRSTRHRGAGAGAQLPLLLSSVLVAIAPVSFGSSGSSMIHCLCLQGDEMAQRWSIWAPSCPCCHLLSGLRNKDFVRESLAQMPHRDWNRQRLNRQMPGRSLSMNHHHYN